MSGFSEFREGWPVVLASALGIALGMSPLPFYTIGVFAGPFMQEFGWQINQVMSALAVFTMVAMLSAPLVGYLTDRVGVRKVGASYSPLDELPTSRSASDTTL